MTMLPMLPMAPAAVDGGIAEEEDHLTVSDVTMPNAIEVDDLEDPMEETTVSPSVDRLGPNLLASENPKPDSFPAGNGIPSTETDPANDPPSTQHTWTIENFSKITTRKKYSEPFEIGVHKWRLLIFPKGNASEHLAIYLDVAETGELPIGWSRDADFVLSVVNQGDPTLTVKKEAKHKFSSKECDWGFTTFMTLVELNDQGKGFLLKDTLIIEANVCIKQDYWVWDSKKATGYVGLKNQGATCYMNSLLQTLYHIPFFRKAVYHMPTTENDEAASSLAVALQSLFYKLQYSDTSVSTKDLTKSFGWDAFDSFMQHDVQELNRVLCEKLEDKMKGTTVEGTIQQLFEGHHMNYIECINVEYKSDRKESFYDLQLDVKGCADVYASFDKYTEVEDLVGDNKYAAEQHGLQDARKGVSFLDFPPVLQLQLKRFEYDFIRDTMVKINDRYAFPLHLDLGREDGRYLAPGADRSVVNHYTLHSVLVHSGGVHGGHYYAYISPTLNQQWYKFDDERVTVEERRRALDEQYGGGEELKFTSHSNAYMLVYVRDADRNTILCPVGSSDIAEHLEVRLKREQEEKERKKKEKAEAHLYSVVKIATDADLKEQIGRTLYFDLVDHDRVRSFRVPKQTPFAMFKEEVAVELKVPLPCQRFWTMAKRKNHTFRPSQPLTPPLEAMAVGVGVGASAEVRLYLEGEPWRERGRNEVLLFFKLYDPLQDQLSYAGKLSVSLASKPSDLVEQLCALVGYPPGTPLLLYEEVRAEPVMCELINMEATLKASSMEDGDIICFQRKLQAEEVEGVRFPLVDAFLKYVRYRQEVHFRRLEKAGEDAVTLELSMRNTYDEVAEQLALKLGLDDPTLLRFTLHNCYSCIPRPPALKYRGVERLENMLVHYNQSADIVYFEVLDLPLPELERLKTLSLAFHDLRGAEVGVHTLRLPKTSTVGDVLKEVRGKVEVSHPDAQLRMLEIFDHKIYKIFPTSDPIENFNDHYWRLRVEEIPADQLQSDHRLLHVYHFNKEANVTVHNFGDPLLLTLGATESVGELKGRIRRKLGVAEEEFGTWGVAFVSLGHAEYLKDEDLLAPRLPKKDTCGAWEHYLGLEHADTAPRRHHQNQHRQGYGYEKAVKIYN